MLQISRNDVVLAPFPHVAKQGILPADLFARLKQDYPTEEFFAENHSHVDGMGSRVGADRGFDIYRGDASYDRLIAASSAWRDLDAFINGPEFVESFIAVFGPDLAALGCSIEVDVARYSRGYVEPRAALTVKPTIRERFRQILPDALRFHERNPMLFSRLDIGRSYHGYAKPPHCDRENRLCSLIIYFTDMAAERIEGGELNIYRHKSELDAIKHKRHPHVDSVDIVETLVPAPNLGVFFPCSNNSYHGVNAVRTPGKARDFLYINISTVSASCWK